MFSSANYFWDSPKGQVAKARRSHRCARGIVTLRVIEPDVNGLLDIGLRVEFSSKDVSRLICRATTCRRSIGRRSASLRSYYSCFPFARNSTWSHKIKISIFAQENIKDAGITTIQCIVKFVSNGRSRNRRNLVLRQTEQTGEQLGSRGNDIFSRIPTPIAIVEQIVQPTETEKKGENEREE